MTHRRRAAVALAATASLGLAGCGVLEPSSGKTTTVTQTDDSQTEPTDGDGGQTDPTDGDQQTEPTDGDGDSGSDQAAPGGTTAPGTHLKIGEKATVSDKNGNTVEVTVTGIRDGKASDLSVFDNASDMAGKTPKYVDFELTGTDRSEKLFDFSFITGLDPAASPGQKAQRLNVMATSAADFQPCPFDTPSKLAQGETAKVCSIALVEGSQQVTGGAYDPIDGQYSKTGAIFWNE